MGGKSKFQSQEGLFSVILEGAKRLIGSHHAMKKYYSTYIVTNKIHTVLYTGVTNNLKRRVYLYKNALGSQFANKYKVSKLVYFEVHEESLTAIKREKQLKNLVRRKKISLIDSKNPYWKDLYYKL